MLGNVLMWDKAQGTWRAAGDRVLALHPGSALAKKSEKSDKTDKAAKEKLEQRLKA